VLILDAVRDPGNLGTILRAGAAAGVQAVLLSPTCVDAYNPKALRSGMGAHFRVPIVEMDWDKIGAYCRALAVYLADAEGDLSHDAVDWSAAWALIIGSEAHGAGSEAERLAQQRVYIPMAAATESLNAAIAAAVILFEAARQGQHKT
jgi:TrmH family RNA methyltransferase